MKNFVHRDLKPENFCMGLGRQRNTTFLIDLGLCKRYAQHGKHIAYREGKSLTGTARYCSINSHLGIELTRRDDIESLGYILVYFARGSLPWQGIPAKSKKHKQDRIMEKKLQTPIHVLCRGLPQQFAQFLQYSRQLKFEERPDYGYLRAIFQDLYKQDGYAQDQQYDWDVEEMM